MADNGNGIDHRILRDLCRNTKLYEIPIFDTDTKIDRELKVYFNRYLHHWRDYQSTKDVWQKNIHISHMTKIPYKMNRIRIKHWYWKQLRIK